MSCRTGESNLRKRRDGPMFYQLSYIPPLETIFTKNHLRERSLFGKSALVITLVVDWAQNTKSLTNQRLGKDTERKTINMTTVVSRRVPESFVSLRYF